MKSGDGTALNKKNDVMQVLSSRAVFVTNIIALLDILLHATLLVLFIVLKPNQELLLLNGIGLGVCVLALIMNQFGKLSSSVASMLLMLEIGVISVVWMAYLGFGGLLYFHLFFSLGPHCMITSDKDRRSNVKGGIVHVLVFVCTVACIVVGILVPPIAGTEDLTVFAALTIISVFILRSLDNIFGKLSVSQRFETYEKTITSAVDDSMTDPLTGLWNRRYLQSNSEAFHNMAKTLPCSVAMLDLDFFKNVNDVYNHLVGDKMLAYFSSFLKRNLRTSDHILRWGGEEFLIIFTNTDVKQAQAVLNNLREDFKASPMTHGDTEIPMTFTAGLCKFNADVSITAAVESADALLYSGKKSGRDRVVSIE